MHSLDDPSKSTLSGVSLGPFPHLRKIVQSYDAQQNQEAQLSTIINGDDYIPQSYEPISTAAASLKIALTPEAPSSDSIITSRLETTLKEHISMDTHHSDFTLKEAISEPSFFFSTQANEGYCKKCSSYHAKGFSGCNIFDLSINPIVRVNANKKIKSEDANFSVFTQCLELAREDEKFHYYPYHLQQGSSSQALRLETLEFPPLFTELTSVTDHTLGTENDDYQNRDSEKRGETFYLARSNGLVPHYALALHHMEPLSTQGLEEENDPRMPRLSESATLSLERQHKAVLWTIETMLCN
ncbi:unnamed protein product [Phytomonas sp. Hart1]|nr:unnamed protein product [Phytomonas sp. Hart1]|eukprot:CCW71343.1 unnamed protein product [Phytomonas sp. isolate Hart1]